MPNKKKTSKTSKINRSKPKNSSTSDPVVSNKSKQKKRETDKVVKADQKKRKESTDDNSIKEGTTEVVQVQFIEDGEVVEMEVDGLQTEFMSEEEEDSDHEMQFEDNNEDNEIVFVQLPGNHNENSSKKGEAVLVQKATLCSNETEVRKEIPEDLATPSSSAKVDKSFDELDKEEEAFFERFHRYMAKKGLLKANDGNKGNRVIHLT